MPRILANVLHHILNYSVVFLVVNFEPETFTFLQYPSPQKRCFFPNSSRKDQCINFALQLDVVATDEAKDPINEYVKSQFTSGIR